MQDVHNVQICGVYPDCKTTHGLFYNQGTHHKFGHYEHPA